MLVLTRELDQKLILTLPDGRRCELVIVAIRGKTVRIGFAGPQDVKFHRSEVQEQIDREGKS